jgi:hypothetical protein
MVRKEIAKKTNYFKLNYSIFIGWTIELDKFTDKKTVLGPKTFTNLIATLDPNAEAKLVLACHIDSKIEPGKLTNDDLFVVLLIIQSSMKLLLAPIYIF